MKKVFTLLLVCSIGLLGFSQTVIYENTFESGLGSASIVGSGALVDDATPGFGKVFHNVGASGTEAIRTNYLVLPTTIFSDLQNSGKSTLTISFWVNVGTATNYWFTPLFTAYGANQNGGNNSWPMLAIQSRLLAQINVAGYCDFLAINNDAGTNYESTVWMDDAQWHYFAAVYTPTTLKLYIDGTLKNAWTVDGVSQGQVIGGIFTNGSELTHICLGGNQAWDWADHDAAYMFDDIAIYSDALTTQQMTTIMTAKTQATPVVEVDSYRRVVATSFYSLSGVKVGSSDRDLPNGIYIKVLDFDNGERSTSKLNIQRR